VSSTNRGATRSPNDGYQTRPQDIAALLRHVRPCGAFLEPCSGSGNIVRAVKPLVAYIETCEITEGSDFLIFQPLIHYRWIITNPPFSLACEFIDRSLGIADNMAMLLRLNFLGAGKRLDWWQDKRPTALYVLAHRPDFLDRDGNRVLGKDGKPGKDSCEYAWFVWSRLYSGIHVIDNSITEAAR